MDASEIKNVEAEAGIIASVLLDPTLTYHSEQLKPNYFTDSNNAYIYYAVCELAKQNVESVDVYNITNILNAKQSTRKATETITIQSLSELIDVAGLIARKDPNDYMVLVKSVIDCAFRRNTYRKLMQCQNICFDKDSAEIENKIYKLLDDVMLEFSTESSVPEYKDIVDKVWEEIKSRQDQNGGISGIPFKFNTLTEYVTIEPGELIVFGAEAKRGKSMMMLNCAVDLLNRGLKVLYIDSELSTRLFTTRLLSNLTGIGLSRIKSGRYDKDEERRIEEALAWVKQQSFVHLYMPLFDAQTIFRVVKKIKHQMGIDVLIIDYFKSKSEGDAFASYQDLGYLVDMVKNRICGDMDIAGIGAAQATSTGKLADSAKIERNASTIIMIEDKTQEEIDADGIECGNKKLVVRRNRNGAQHYDGEYIDLFFDGDTATYTEVQQHATYSPY